MKKQLFLIASLTSTLFYSQTSAGTRDDAGAATNLSGFFETSNPVNYPGGGGWWHLLDVRHTAVGSNFGMQFAGRFDDQDLWFRKTNGNASQDWRRAVLETNGGLVEIAKWPSTGKLIIYNNTGGASGSNQFELRTNLSANTDHYFMKNIISGTGTENTTFSLRHDGQMFVSGNIGIGTNAPTEKLDVLGNIRIGSTHSTEGINALSIRYQNGSLNNWGSLRSSSATFMSFGVKADNTVSNGWLSSDGSLNDKLAFAMSSNTGFSFLSANQQATAINSPVTMTEVMKITPSGNAALQGKFEAKEIKVTLTPTADFVFENDYNLPKLEDVEKHIKEKKHLPEIASAKEMEKEGVNVGEFQIKLLQKIEELTLYTIEQNKLLKEQGEVIKEQQKRIEKLEANTK
ncbi:hypothetical protein [Chryseobacterium hispalense]|uniref:hypothetical protein n=1 Tax=Chryseobacterium hispalense TaxID=1453492 RepID=UPI001E5A4FA7|nr:hypothetical protein [Chryseobacterium hispalense]